MRKTYVLDTSVLINDPDALGRFDEHEVILPYVVVHELDGLRKAPNGRGVAAREVIRKLEEMRVSNPRLTDVPVGEGGTMSVLVNESDFGAIDLPKAVRDDIIVKCAARLREEGREAIVVSKDIGLRIKASTLAGVEAQDYMATKLMGWNARGCGLYREDVSVKLSGYDLHSGEVAAPETVLENEFCYAVGEDGYASCGRVLCRNKGGFLRPVGPYTKGIQGVRPQDEHQRMAIDALLDPEVSLVTLTGVAGSGKTLLSLAAGLDALSNGEVSAIMYVKPIVPVGGRDIGYLKGDKEDKLWEWVKPLFDNLRVLGMTNGKKQWDEEMMLAEGQLELEALTFMRGRTLHGYWVILDECQNVSGMEMRTALSRMGEKTKCVVLADPTQIDNPYVDAESCGAAAVVDQMRGHEVFAAVPLVNSHRSRLSQAVNERMKG